MSNQNQPQTDHPPQSKARRGCLAAVGLLLVALLGAFLFLRSRIDSEAITQAVLAQLESSTGLQLEIDGFDRAGLFGVTVRQPTVRALLPAGCFSADAEALDISWQLRPLLRRRVVIDTLELVSPQMRLDTGGQGPDGNGCFGASSAGASANESPEAPSIGESPSDVAPADGAASSALAVAGIEVQRLLLSSGTVQVFDSTLAPANPDQAPSGIDPTLVLALEQLDIEITDIQLETDSSSSFWQGARGSITAPVMNAGGILASDLEGELQIDQGTLTVEPLAFDVPQGRIETTLVAQLDQDPLSYTVAVGADVAVDKVIRGEITEKTSMGVGRLDLAGGAVGTDPNDLSASGTLVLPAGSLDGHPIATALALVLGDPGLIDLAYRTETAHFDIEQGRLTLTQPLRLLSDTSQAGAMVEIEIGGSAGIDATTEPTLDLTVTARIPRSRLAIKELPDEVFDALENDEGLVELPLAIQGSLQDPRVRLDRDAILRLAGNSLKREAGRRLLRGLGRLIDG